MKKFMFNFIALAMMVYSNWAQTVVELRENRIIINETIELAFGDSYDAVIAKLGMWDKKSMIDHPLLPTFTYYYEMLGITLQFFYTVPRGGVMTATSFEGIVVNRNGQGNVMMKSGDTTWNANTHWQALNKVIEKIANQGFTRTLEHDLDKSKHNTFKLGHNYLDIYSMKDKEESKTIFYYHSAQFYEVYETTWWETKIFGPDAE